MAVKKKEPMTAPEPQENQEFPEAFEEADAPVEAAPAPRAEPAQEPAYRVYIGPSIRGGITENAIIPREGMAYLQDALAKYPDIKILLIPGDKLGEARAALKKKDGYLRAVYTRLAAKA
jgi:hypothetical protein